MKSDARGRDGGVRQALAEGVKFTGPDAPSAASSWSGTRQVLYSITKHAMRRSANEIGQLRFHFGRKCLAIRHRLLTEFFPPIESARQESNRAHASLAAISCGICKFRQASRRRGDTCRGSVVRSSFP